ncbi:lytic transglycosylase domain-containing protein, partial [Crenalkalicoccus roseus]|uniref:lytic transglycosylase domain-containing protein n=1 Tax=Crenalkalicoccus roseus TaxID=1485588 RepID=UPI0010805AAF
MPQGDWTRRGGAQGGARRAVRGVRPVLALSVIALLAACGSQTTTRDSAQQGGRIATHGAYNRPASYDPPGPPHDPWGPWIREASRRFDVPERWIREVMRQESGGRPHVTSRAGAMGLMQVMPGTYRELQARYGLGDDPYHPYDSIMAGTAYIREMYELYGSPAFLAAYNAGPRRLEDYLWSSRGLPAETRNYVARIGPNILGHHPNRRARPEVYAAAEIPLHIPPGPRRMDGATMLALREQRQAVDPGIQVAQLPPGPIVRMDPIPDGSTGPLPPPAPSSWQLASTETVVRMDPIPDGATEAGAARLAEAAARQRAGDPPPPAPPPRA